MKRGPQRTVRGFAERIPGTSKFQFTCPAGHVTVDDINKGRRTGMKVGESGLALYARYWAKTAGGVSFHCPKCFPRSA